MSMHLTQSSPELEPDTTTPTTSATNAVVQHPAQEKFNDHEQEFLAKYLNQYLAVEASNMKKGAKKHWVKENIYYKYIKEFESDSPTGPDLLSLFKPVKKPCTTNAMELFAQSHWEELHVTTSTRVQQNRSTTYTPGGNLLVYHDVKQQAFEGQSDTEKAHWETLAQEHNVKITVPPTVDYFYDHQSKLADNASTALLGLIGNEWNQHGDVVFFLQGMYCNKNNMVKTFQQVKNTLVVSTAASNDSPKEDMHSTSAMNVPALAHRPNGKVSGNSGSFPNHDNTESGGSSHMDTIQDSTKGCTKCVIEDNNASDAVLHKRKLNPCDKEPADEAPTRLEQPKRKRNKLTPRVKELANEATTRPERPKQ
ncbi:hypothetical protein PILCRDRAFT_89865 [Piloderma croceum F 1598]|uniref:Uncharacterized protein n=1 Tax=Piloderma croceum (strain F 1598) TaxID=765440 RepID=A0A0C3FJK3_PILCF|nr:hypothetical protein PILCRDRAFT_89865 [Piloderma croceum F 1598]